MSTNNTTIPIPGRLHSVSSDGIVTGADEIFDDTKQKFLNVINQEVDQAISELDEAISSGGSIDTRIQDAIDDVLNQKGSNNGIASLDSTGKVPTSQLPSYVDDIIEGYYYNDAFYKEAAHTTVITAESGKIYIDLVSNKSYRWSGSTYIVIGGGSEDNAAFLENNLEEAVVPDFDPSVDALRKTTQVLTTAEKDQVAQNLNNRPSSNGMARIELKATDNFKSVVEAQTGGNTIFVIKYDYTLTGDVTIPSGCILDFQGGSISGAYTLIGQNTIVKGEKEMFGSLGIAGTWNVPYISSSFFKDLSGLNSLKQLFNLANDNIFNKIIIEKRSYNYQVSFTNLFEAAFTLTSNTDLQIDGVITVNTNGLNGYRLFFINNKSNIRIYGAGSLIGDADTHDYTATQEYEGQTLTTHEFCHGICCYDSLNVSVSELTITKFPGDGLSFANTLADTDNKLSINNVTISDCGRQGITLIQNNAIVENCSISGIKRISPKSAIDIEPNIFLCKASNIIIRNNSFDDCSHGVSLISSNGPINGILIENNRSSSIENNSIYSAGQNTKNVTIKNNSFVSEFGSLVVPYIENLTIENNSLNSSSGAGIYNNPGTKNILISNNTVICADTCAINSAICTMINNYIEGTITSDSKEILSVEGTNFKADNNLIKGAIKVTVTLGEFCNNKIETKTSVARNDFGVYHFVIKNNHFYVSGSSSTMSEVVRLIGSYIECSMNMFELENSETVNVGINVHANAKKVLLKYNRFMSLFSSATIKENSTNDIIIEGLYANFRKTNDIPEYKGSNRDTQSEYVLYVDNASKKVMISNGTGTRYDALGNVIQ